MKIQGIGVPFSLHQSSCSNRTPKNFEWTDEDSSIQVWMDMRIPFGVQTTLETKEENVKRYAWFCESKEIVPYLQQAFDNELILEQIVDTYDGIFTCDREMVAKHE